MLNLPTNSSKILVITGAAVSSIAVFSSWVDLGTAPPPPPVLPQPVTPNALNTIITTATITTVVPSPPAGSARNVKFLSVTNTSALPCLITIQNFDGTTAVTLFPTFALPSGWSIQYNTDGDGFRVYDQNGKIQVSAQNTVIVGGVALSAGTQQATSGTVQLANSNGLTFGMSNSSIVTASYSTAVFSNSNNVSFGTNVSTVTASAFINVSAGTTSNNLTAITLSNSNGISFGLNNGTLTASISGVVGTITAFSQDADFVTNFPAAQAVLSLQKLSIPLNLLATQLVMLAALSGHSASSGALTISHAIYTLVGGTANLASSAFRVVSFTSGGDTAATSQYAGASGTRYRSVSVSYAMTPGDYLFGWWVSTENGVTANLFGRAGLNIVGEFDAVETNYFLNGSSVSSVAAFPATIAATNTNYARTGLSAMLQPGAILIGTH